MVERATEQNQQGAETDQARILVVDDEESLCELLELILREEGYQVDSARDRSSALRMFDEHSYDVVLQDIKLGDASGIDLLKQYSKRDEACRVIMITAYSTQESAVDAMRKGAFDYFKKPFDNDEIRSGVRSALESLRREQSETQDEVPISNHLVGDSEAIKNVRKTMHQVAPSNVTVMISGESGTGKELVARSLHLMSARNDHPFMSVNCGAFPETLLESELFGHKKGAFTGAHEDKKGLLEVADGGTLFLDEIAEMPPEMQVKLLRVLEDQEFKPVGGVQNRRVDLRFIGATNQDIEQLVQEGAFREDLYYRLNVIHLSIPPLRERGEDVLLLAGYFLNEYEGGDSGESAQSRFSEEARDQLLSYPWPGNVRELKNAVRRAVTLSDGGIIGPELLFENKRNGSQQQGDESLPEEGIDLDDRLEQVEKQYIRRALKKTDQNITEAADLLNISFRSLRYKIDKYDIETKSDQ